ncbi:MAG: hypothetical protein K0Q49_2357 [Haloplasmataceae bacterium]|jgi:hypothetical protein|nr:hypothetical protein [Haloplasmataceae bacterium]
MKKYIINDKLLKEVLPYFIHNGYLDEVTISEIDSVLSFLIRRKKKYKNKAFLLIDDTYNIIAITDKLRQTCYIYSNCGINFNINDFLDQLFKYLKSISAIVCDQILYKRLKDYLYEDYIIFEKSKDIYSITANDLLKSEINNKTIYKQTIILSDLAYEVLFFPFIKILDDHHLFFLSNKYAGIILVDNSTAFINTFYTLNEVNQKVYLDSTKFIEGSRYNLNEDVLVYDLDELIKSIIIIRNSLTCYEIVFSDSIFENDLLTEFKLLIDILQINDDLFYLVNTDHFDYKRLLSLGFNNINQKVYFYYFHNQSNIDTIIPEINKDLHKANQLTNLILKYFINLLGLPLLHLFNYFFPGKEYDLYFIMSIAFFILTITIPSLIINKENYYYKNKVFKTTHLKFSPYYLVAILMITLFFIAQRYE